MGKRWLNLYVSEGPTTIKKFIELGVITDYLISFAHFAKAPDKVPKAHLDAVKKAGHKLMLDSGAITNMLKPGTVEFEPYKEYLKSEGEYWDEYITLDALGSRTGTIKNFELLKGEGLRPLFVDHLKYDTDGRSVKIFKAEDKLCLSGWGKKPHVPNKDGQKKDDSSGNSQDHWESGKKRPKGAEMARRLNERVEMARGKKTKVHMLAIGSLLRFLPFMDVITSADTAAPTRAVGYGTLLFATEKVIGGVKIPMIGYTAAPFVTGEGRKVIPEVQKRFKEWRASTKFKNETENTAARCWNVLQIKTYEAKINATSPDKIIAAWNAEKEARKRALEKSAVYSFPAELDPWFGMEASVLDDPSFIVSKAEDAIRDSLVQQSTELLTSLDIDEIGTFEDPEETDDNPLEKQTAIQTLMLSKEKFDSLEAAKAWVKDHDFKVAHKGKEPDETEDSYRFRQADPGDFQEGSFRTIEITDGVKAVVGRPKDSKEKACSGGCTDCELCSRVAPLIKSEGEFDVRLLVDLEKADDRRIVFGVVLEPNEVDTQGDTIKPDEIELAAHLWLARFQDRGLMHKEIVNGKIEIYESYIAPTDLTLGKQKVKKGTWLLMYHILDDALWKDIKSGKLTGFSMGGFARRRPT